VSLLLGPLAHARIGGAARLGCSLTCGVQVVVSGEREAALGQVARNAPFLPVPVVVARCPVRCLARRPFSVCAPVPVGSCVLCYCHVETHTLDIAVCTTNAYLSLRHAHGGSRHASWQHGVVQP